MDNESLRHLIEQPTTNRRSRAASMTLEALMYSLRERGVEALKERDTRRRLSELSHDQLVEVGRRCQALKLGRGPWSEEDIETLMRLHTELI